MKTHTDRARLISSSFNYRSAKMQHTTTTRRIYGPMTANTYNRDKPIVHEIFLTLEELWTGCSKKMKIAAKVFGENLRLERTDEKIIKVEVPPGAKDGAKVVIPSAGNKKPGTIPGDVIFVIRERKHARFTRDSENNLIHRVEITLRDALTGCNVQVPLLCGESLTLSTTDVVCDGARKCIPGKGMPRGATGTHGDLLVHFSVTFPTSLTDKQKETIASVLPDLPDDDDDG